MESSNLRIIIPVSITVAISLVMFALYIICKRRRAQRLETTGELLEVNEISQPFFTTNNQEVIDGDTTNVDPWEVPAIHTFCLTFEFWLNSTKCVKSLQYSSTLSSGLQITCLLETGQSKMWPCMLSLLILIAR